MARKCSPVFSWKSYLCISKLVLWPLSFLVFHKILSFLPTSDRQKCLIPSYTMSKLLRLSWIPIWRCLGTAFYFSETTGLFGLAQRCTWGFLSFTSNIILYLFSSLSFCSLSLFSSKICIFAFFALYALFPNEDSTFFFLQVFCSALNRDLPMGAFWGISVSNWYMWHLFNKLCASTFRKREISAECYWSVPSSSWVLAVL